MDPRIERIKNAADYLVGVLAGRQPEIGIVLGSGLGKLADQIADPLVIPYKETRSSSPTRTSPVSRSPRPSATRGISSSAPSAARP